MLSKKKEKKKGGKDLKIKVWIELIFLDAKWSHIIDWLCFMRGAEDGKWNVVSRRADDSSEIRNVQTVCRRKDT